MESGEQLMTEETEGGGEKVDQKKHLAERRLNSRRDKAQWLEDLFHALVSLQTR